MNRHMHFEVAGHKLAAAIHAPDHESPSCTGLLLLHGWAGYRIGAHRMLVKLSRRAEQRGIPSLRFDFRGRGDSEGDTMETNLTTMIEDTIAAARVLIAETSADHVALVGDCSGGEVAIGAAPLIDACTKIILWSTPIVGGERAASDAAKKRHIALQYVRKVFRAQTWAKLFSGRLQFGMIKKALLGGGKGAGEEGSAADEDIDWQGRFSGFEGDVFFIYGGNDPTAEATIDHYRRLTDRAGRQWHCKIIEGANHAFYSLDWEREVIDTTLDWAEPITPEGEGSHAR